MLVSLGGEGSILLEGDAEIHVPAPKVTVVDTVGAGDTLNGALAAFLARGWPLDRAARTANQAAAMAVTRSGAREGMPTLAELGAVLGS